MGILGPHIETAEDAIELRHLIVDGAKQFLAANA